MPEKSPISTDRQIAALRPRTNKYDAPIKGASEAAVRVYPTGTKVFQYRYVTADGRRRRMVLGGYPALSLSDARAKVLALSLEVIAGNDPARIDVAPHQTENQKAAIKSGTLQDLADGYWPAAAKGLHGGRKRPKSPKTIAIEKMRWRKHIGPVLGDRLYSDIRRSDIKAYMRELAIAGALAPDSIGSVGGTLSSILAFGVHEDLIETNPATGLTKPLATRTRTRMFSDRALATLWRALLTSSRARVRGEERADLAARLEPVTALALRLALLTLCRRNEIAGALWGEVDEQARTWTVPAERTKARRRHVVPLSDQALLVLHDARALSDGDIIFPAPRSEDGSIEPEALTRAVSRLCKRFELPHGTPHDFRRTGATTLTSERYGVRRFVISKVLGHAAYDGGAAVTEIYDLNDYLPEKRSALGMWGGHLAAMSLPPGDGNGVHESDTALGPDWDRSTSP